MSNTQCHEGGTSVMHPISWRTDQCQTLHVMKEGPVSYTLYHGGRTNVKHSML